MRVDVDVRLDGAPDVGHVVGVVALVVVGVESCERGKDGGFVGDGWRRVGEEGVGC